MRVVVIWYSQVGRVVVEIKAGVVALQGGEQKAAGGEVPCAKKGATLPAAPSFTSPSVLAARIGWGGRWLFRKISEDRSSSSASSTTSISAQANVEDRQAEPPSTSSSGKSLLSRRHPIVRRAQTEPNVIAYNPNRRRSSLGESTSTFNSLIIYIFFFIIAYVKNKLN